MATVRAGGKHKAHHGSGHGAKPGSHAGGHKASHHDGVKSDHGGRKPAKRTNKANARAVAPLMENRDSKKKREKRLEGKPL